MKILRNIAIALTVLLLTAIGAVAEGFYRFDLQLNPIARHIIDGGGGKSWGTRVSMVPKPFLPKTSRVTVEQRLRNAGFKSVSENLALAEIRDDVDKGREIYSREANMIVCNIQLYVFLAFEASDELAYAEGTQYEHGCL